MTIPVSFMSPPHLGHFLGTFSVSISPDMTKVRPFLVPVMVYPQPLHWYSFNVPINITLLVLITFSFSTPLTICYRIYADKLFQVLHCNIFIGLLLLFRHKDTKSFGQIVIFPQKSLIFCFNVLHILTHQAANGDQNYKQKKYTFHNHHVLN